MPDRHAGDREILDCAQRMDAPIGIGRNIPLAKKVVLAPGRDVGEFDGAGRRNRDRIGRGLGG